MKNEIIGKFIIEGLSDEMSQLPEESKKTFHEINKINEQIELLKQMESIDSNEALLKVKSYVAGKKTFHWSTLVQRIAAFLILPLLSFVVWQSIQLNDFQSKVTINTITTPPTLRSNFTLPDGTKVWLNSNTKITYPTQFDGKERMVSLTGEAYFEVAKNKRKPFLVNINNLLIEATGTQFNIASYSDDLTKEILLTEGSVNILSAKDDERKQLTELKINELAKFDVTSRKLRIQKVDPEKYIAWKAGKIIFCNDRLTDVIKKLERWYNVDFTYSANAMRDYAFTGTFAGEDLAQILKCIELTSPIHFEIGQLKVNQNNEFQKTIIDITNIKQ